MQALPPCLYVNIVLSLSLTIGCSSALAQDNSKQPAKQSEQKQQPPQQPPAQGYPPPQQYPPANGQYRPPGPYYPPPYPGQPYYPPAYPAYPGYPPPQQMQPQYPPQQYPPPAQWQRPPQQAYPPQQPYQQGQPQSSANLGPEKNKKPADNMSEFLSNVNSARQMISSGNPAFAVESLDKAVQLRPRNLSVYFYRGLAYDESGDPSKAVKDYLESIDRAKTVGMDSAELRINLGNSYMKLDYIPDAIVEYQRAIEIDPASGNAHMQLGRALLTKSDYGGALRNFRKADSFGFNDPALPYLKALALAGLGEKQSALAELAPLLAEDASSSTPQLHKLAEELKNDLK